MSIINSFNSSSKESIIGIDRFNIPTMHKESYESEDYRTDMVFPTSWTAVTSYTKYKDSNNLGYIVTASSSYSSTYAAKNAFATSGSWQSNNATGDVYITLQLPEATKITKMEAAVSGTSPVTIQGSKNGTSWTDLYTVSGASTSVREFVLNNRDYYTYYRFYKNRASKAQLIVSNWQPLEYATPETFYNYYLDFDIPYFLYENNVILNIVGIAYDDKTVFENPYIKIGNNDAKQIVGTIRAGKYYNIMYNGAVWLVQPTTFGLDTNAIVITSSGTYDIDPDISYRAIVIGAGGGASATYYYWHAMGGGAGGKIEDIFKPTSNTTEVIIGAPGVNHYSRYDASSGTNGGYSQIGNLIAYGGNGGVTNSSSQSGGEGGTVSGGVGYDGHNGSKTDGYWHYALGGEGWTIDGITYGNGGSYRYMDSEIKESINPTQGVVILYPMV